MGLIGFMGSSNGYVGVRTEISAAVTKERVIELRARQDAGATGRRGELAGCILRIGIQLNGLRRVRRFETKLGRSLTLAGRD